MPVDKKWTVNDSKAMRKRRLALGLTLLEVAELIPTGIATLSRWETGKKIPRQRLMRTRWVEVLEALEANKSRKVAG